MSPRRLYGIVAACALVVYVGALWNKWALDDLLIVAGSPLVHSSSGWWRAFLSPYWPPELGASLYRPLTVASYVLDWHLDGPAWFHAVNVLWHVGASVLVAALTRRWLDDSAALVAGVVFAVHPVHVEAVAMVVGRAELMGAVFVLLAVYAALERRSVGWSAACWALGLLCKENAAVAPALIVTAWACGVGRPSRRQVALFVVSWVVVGVAYLAAREAVLHRYPAPIIMAAVFIGQRPSPARLTAVAALADVTRLLLVPLKLRADYSPQERTIVSTPLDWRFAAGALCVIGWLTLAAAAWRRGRRVEVLGLAWMAIAFAPVSNLLFPVGILIAERTLYLPSAGLAIAAGGFARTLPRRTLWLVVAGLALVGGVLTARRVPVWRNNLKATMSILEDSPRSYVGPMIMAAIYLEDRRPDKALEAARLASAAFPLEARPYLAGAHAAYLLGQPRVADSLLARADHFCNPCRGFYEAEATVARRLGDGAVADSLLLHAERFTGP